MDPISTLKRIQGLQLKTSFGILVEELNDGKIHVKESVRIVSKNNP